jgi:hypothetical protein
MATKPNICTRPEAALRQRINNCTESSSMLKALLTLLTALALVFTPARSAEIRDVSMIQLIVNPERYDGSPIRVIAFLNLEFEGDALYLHREDYQKSIFSNAISISLTDRQIALSTKLSGGYVLVEGIFREKNRGHFGMFSGSIEQITQIQRWERRRK